MGDNASLLAFRASSAAEALTAEELPASLLRGGLLKLRAFSSERSQARRGMRKQCCAAQKCSL